MDTRHRLAYWLDAHRIPASIGLWLAILFLASIAGLFLPSKADAGTVTFDWTHPTSYVGGAPLSLSDLASTRLEWGTCNAGAFGTKQGETVIAAPASTATVTLAAGTYCVRAYSKLTAAKGGLESGPSGLLQNVVVPNAIPNPPSGLSAVSIQAWDVMRNNDGSYRLARQVGTVSLGIACTGSAIVTTTAGKFYRVDTGAVAKSMPVSKWKSPYAVVRCEAA